MSNKSDKSMIKAMILMADGFEEIEAVTVADILRRAEITAELISVSDSLEVRGAHGVKLLCDGILSTSRALVREADAVILPGGGEGTQNLKNCAAVSELVVYQNEKGKMVAAICAAPAVLGAAGILHGKKAVCYPGFENELDGARIVDESVVVSGNVITAKAAGCAAPFALKIAEILICATGLDGVKVSQKIMEQMYY